MKNRHAARLTLATVIVCIVAALAAGARAARVEPARAALPASAQTFNLADFGAVGDGVADDGPALQAALDAVIAAGGGTLLVPAGHFAIATPVTAVPTVSRVPIEIRGVPSSTQVAPPTAAGDQLSRGLDLQSEFLPRTGSQVALTFGSLSSLLV